MGGEADSLSELERGKVNGTIGRAIRGCSGSTAAGSLPSLLGVSLAGVRLVYPRSSVWTSWKSSQVWLIGKENEKACFFEK